MMEDAEKHRQADAAKRERIEARNKVEHALTEVEKNLREHRARLNEVLFFSAFCSAG